MKRRNFLAMILGTIGALPFVGAEKELPHLFGPSDLEFEAQWVLFQDAVATAMRIPREYLMGAAAGWGKSSLNAQLFEEGIAKVLREA